jgi:hypothetical protein
LSTKTPFWWTNIQQIAEHNTRINNKMPKLKYIATTLLLAFCSIAMNAQTNEVMLNLRTGHNASFGGFAAASLEASNTISNSFKINSGIQYSSINKTAIEARPAYYKSLDWGKLSAEALLAYTNLSSINNIAAGAGLQVESKWADARLGYYYRLYGGKEGWIKEPFNLYYELSAHLIPSIENWDLNLIITNCETLELETLVSAPEGMVLSGFAYTEGGAVEIAADAIYTVRGDATLYAVFTSTSSEPNEPTPPPSGDPDEPGNEKPTKGCGGMVGGSWIFAIFALAGAAAIIFGRRLKRSH